MKRTGCKGYLTIYLTMVMAILISLCLALIEGTRYNAICLESECVMDIGLNSILAEYHRELMTQYNLFAIDSSYGTAVAGSANVEEHLGNYLNKNLTNDTLFLSDFLYCDFLALSVQDINMTKVSYLTDGNGKVFRLRAEETVKDDLGLTGLEHLMTWMETVEEQELLDRDIEQERQETNNLIIRECALSEVNNPVEELESVRKKGILRWVVDAEEELSAKALNSTELIAERMKRGECNQGNLELPQQTTLDETEETFLFHEYLMHYMGHYRNPKANSAMDYQIEYLIAGKEEDIDNLKSVANRLCGLREVANTIYLYSDEQKVNEVEVLAFATSLLLGNPELEEPLKIALILGWAYAESMHDVKVLLAGGKVPLMKEKADWHYSLTNALQMKQEEVTSGRGLSYEDYLRILLMVTGEETLTMRAMNMVEADIRMSPGNHWFRMDACMDYVEMNALIDSKYGYCVNITRSKTY